MRPINDILIEIILLSVLTVVLLFPISYIMTGKNVLENKKGLKEMFIGSILLVNSTHMLFEFSGINRSWYLSTYK